MVQLNSAAACAENKTPRIIDVNGTQPGIVFKPGDSLNIAGCGFGAADTGNGVFLAGVSGLIIDSRDGANIRAHVSPGLTRIPDIAGSVRLQVTPKGSPAIISPSFGLAGVEPYK